MNKKLQSAIEFMIMIGFVLFFFFTFFFIINANLAEEFKERNNKEVKNIALTAQDEISLAVEASDGYSRQFELPEKVANRDYDINIIESLIYLNTTDGEYALALPTVNVSGNLKTGSNTIRKQNGEVLLNE